MKLELTIAQAAAALRVSESKVRRLIAGRKDVHDIGLKERKYLRIPEDVVKALHAQLWERERR